ncbi:MAG: HAD family hydrolase [Myxococcales bacterium]|nr:HAD family hydrolase [Myxococcales bacterium]MCB9629722.1 HAD family hydrolase [Sandaracinaceae bacterium]
MENSVEKLVVLDLDETLVHSSPTRLGRDPDHHVLGYHVYERPGVREFLNDVFTHFAVGIWTASTASYAGEILSRLTDISRFRFVWSREHCSIAKHPATRSFDLLKDIQQLELAGYDPAHILFVDDLPHRLCLSVHNIIQVQPFTGALEDDELTDLGTYMSLLHPVRDVRAVDKRAWRAEVGELRIASDLRSESGAVS